MASEAEITERINKAYEIAINEVLKYSGDTVGAAILAVKIYDELKLDEKLGRDVINPDRMSGDLASDGRPRLRCSVK